MNRKKLTLPSIFYMLYPEGAGYTAKYLTVAAILKLPAAGCEDSSTCKEQEHSIELLANPAASCGSCARLHVQGLKLDRNPGKQPTTGCMADVSVNPGLLQLKRGALHEDSAQERGPGGSGQSGPSLVFLFSDDTPALKSRPELAGLKDQISPRLRKRDFVAKHLNVMTLFPEVKGGPERIVAGGIGKGQGVLPFKTAGRRGQGRPDRPGTATLGSLSVPAAGPGTAD